jgi:hypothetical protein
MSVEFGVGSGGMTTAVSAVGSVGVTTGVAMGRVRTTAVGVPEDSGDATTVGTTVGTTGVAVAVAASVMSGTGTVSRSSGCRFPRT